MLYLFNFAMSQRKMWPALGKQLEVPVGATLIIEEGSIN